MTELQIEKERRAMEEIEKQLLPPTREEQLAAAKKEYEATVAMLREAGLKDFEEKAGIEQAKRKYLKALDQFMK